MEKRALIIRAVSILCGIIAAVGALAVLCSHIFTDNNPLTGIICDVLLALFVICVFVFAGIVYSKYSGAPIRVLYIAASAALILYNIIATPYSPCHDTLNLHYILTQMLNHKEVDIFFQSYMNCWVNNKLTVLCYYPFVRLFGNVEIGVRVLNSVLISGMVLFVYLAVKNFLGGRRCEPVLLILSALSPAMLLTGPYIYLPSLFLGAVAVFALSLKNKPGYVIFLIFTALLFVLRPTSSGFLLAFVTVYLLISIRGKKRIVKSLLMVLLTLAVCAVCKGVTGKILYETGLHPYPALQNSAAVWAFELGTRPGGVETGNCFYAPFDPPEESYDDIQNDFHTLWLCYFKDAFYGTSSADEISNMNKNIEKSIIKRSRDGGVMQLCKNLVYKSENYFKNSYIPYYYKANITDDNMKPEKNYDKRYFMYMNAVFLLFFGCLIINAFKSFKNKRFDAATAAGISAIAVIAVMILLTEVSKKYMFDCFVPMIICISITLTDISKKAPNIRLSGLLLAASAAALLLLPSLTDIKPLRGAKITSTLSDGEYVCDINLKNVCTEDGYYIKTFDGETVNLYGKQTVSVKFPEDCFDAFSVCLPDGSIKRFSAQKIHQDM